jgi:membrane peptidoglycan carboxypeptidase
MSAIPLLRRRRKRQSSRHQLKQSRLAGSFIGLGLLLAILVGALFIGGALVYASITADLPPVGLLGQMLDPYSGSLLQPTRIYDRSGVQLLATLAPQDAPRKALPLDPAAAEHLPDTLERATVALLDPGFWQHPGYRLDGLGSPDEHPTLAQKLVADVLLWNEPPGLRRAIRERILAAELTAIYGREKILEWYLNSANYGRFAYGAESAAQLYFGKPAAQVNLAEAALLASVNLSPAINPLDAPQAALQREQDALGLIEARGLATKDEIVLARFMPVTFKAVSPPLNHAPAFVALALSQLETRFNRARVERGGMIVLTTLDYKLQRSVDCAMKMQLARLSNSNGEPCPGAGLAPLPPGQNVPDAAGSAVVLDPRSGEVLAMVGDSKNGSESPFLTPHRPGTLLTPFVYLAGFTRGLSPATLTWDIPARDNPPPSTPVTYLGPVRLRTALINDSRVPTAQMYEQMGAALVQQTMTPFGLGFPAASWNDLLETQNRYSVLQMAQSYGVFAAQGALIGQPAADGLAPSAILAVRGLDGRSYAEWGSPAVEQVVSGQLAYLVTDVLSANLANLGRPVSVKPGFTSDGSSLWVAGYTPHRVVVVWMGGNGLSQRTVIGLWTATMLAASQDVPPDGWTQPAGVTKLKVCDPSGMLPTPACPNTVDEVFIDGYQPVQADTLFQSFAIDIETGYLATVFTAPHLVKNQVFMQVPPDAESWARASGLPVPPVQYDSLQQPLPNAAVNIDIPGMLAQVQGLVTIRGSAGGAGFSRYRLQYGQGLNPETWMPVGPDGTSPVSAGTLAVWDTSGLRGLYSLQLLVVKSDNSIETATVIITISGQ